MLEELTVRGLGAIDDVDVEFGPGFTAITGETGSGKTMVLTGLGLLLGGRADSGAVAAAAERIEVSGRFRVPKGSQAAARVEDAGGDVDPADPDTLVDLLISRTVGKDGRSRAFAGGRGVPVSLLADLADELVTVHGQADQRGLLRTSIQREALDRFAAASASASLLAYRDAFGALRSIDAELRILIEQSRERAREADLLRHGIAEIGSAAPQLDEDASVDAAIARLSHLDALRAAATAASAAIGPQDDDTGDAMSRVAAARRSLDLVQGRDQALDLLGGRLADVGFALADVAAELAAYLRDLDVDPELLDALQARRGQLRALTRKYGEDVAAVLRWADEAQARLDALEGDDERIETLGKRRVATLDELSVAAKDLSDARQAAAARLSESVGRELDGLAMSGAALRVTCSRRPDSNGILVNGQPVAFGPFGVDEVEFLLSAHAGAAPRPLSKGASGGELSRVMLALEVVLAGSDSATTFVFDEVDAGVGGRAAVEIGRRLAQLSRRAQVIVVTHLAQVAAFADRHLVVSKVQTGSTTRTVVDAVDDTDRLEELARMLSGLSDSELGRGHAAELLSIADAERIQCS